MPVFDSFSLDYRVCNYLNILAPTDFTQCYKKVFIYENEYAYFCATERKKFTIFMKKIFLTAIIGLLALRVSAQKYVPVIKEGTVLTYDAFSRGLGQHITLTLTVTNFGGDPLKLIWNVEGYGTGTFAIPAKALENGSKLVIKQPDPDGVTTLNDDETLAVISKEGFNSLVTDKSFQLNGQKFNLAASDTISYKINDKNADVLHALTDNGKNEIWVLNIPYFPLVYRAKAVTRGLDITLTGIKE